MSAYYEYWYRRSGVRVPAQMITPPLSLLNILELPRMSILHSVNNSPIDYGPQANEYLFRNIQRPIMMEHVINNGDTLGNPRKLNISTDTIIRTYHLKYRRYRYSRSLETAIKDPNTLLVINYGIIPHVYKYMRSLYTEIYKWKNTNAALWKKVEQLANDTDRQQFIVCKLPVVLPSIPDLRLGCGVITQKVIKIFNNTDSLMLLEIWKWLGENRKDSLISNVSDKNLFKVNIIYQESGKWFVVNLGKVNSWRKATKDELSNNQNAPTTGYDTEQIQRRFLRMVLTLFQVRSVAAVAVPNELDTPELTGTDTANSDGKSNDKVVAKDDTLLNKPVENGIEQPEAKIQATIQTPNQVDGGSTGNDKSVIFDIPQDIDQNDTIADDADIDAQLEQELAHLEAISKTHVEKNFDEEGDDSQDAGSYNQELFVEEPATLEDGVINVCDKLADLGLLSAAEYRRYMELSKKYKTIVSPNGVDTLDKFIKVDKKLLKIDNEPMEIDNVTIIDKSMLKSSLINFDKKYINEVMQRDIAGMVMHVQNCGIAVTDYEVEKTEDVLGAFNTYTVRITPVEGTSSSLRFKLPVLTDNGEYYANGVKYRLRRQRGD